MCILQQFIILFIGEIRRNVPHWWQKDSFLPVVNLSIDDVSAMNRVAACSFCYPFWDVLVFLLEQVCFKLQMNNPGTTNKIKY